MTSTMPGPKHKRFKHKHHNNPNKGQGGAPRPQAPRSAVSFETVPVDHAGLPADLDEPVETRSVGGLGQLIVGRLVDVSDYVRSGSANVLTLRFRRDAKPG